MIKWMASKWKIQGTIAKAFWYFLGIAIIILSIGMAASLVIRGTCQVSFMEKQVEALQEQVLQYSQEEHDRAILNENTKEYPYGQENF